MAGLLVHLSATQTMYMIDHTCRGMLGHGVQLRETVTHSPKSPEAETADCAQGGYAEGDSLKFTVYDEVRVCEERVATHLH